MDDKEMTSFGEFINKVRNSKGMSLNQVALYSDISAAQLSRIENGKRGVPKPATIKKIADALKLDYEELMQIAGHIPSAGSDDKDKLPKLNIKDEKDIAKKLEAILNELDNKTGLAFDGEPMNDVTRELVRAQIESNLHTAKQMAKKKFTPKKYRNDEDE